MMPGQRGRRPRVTDRTGVSSRRVGRNPVRDSPTRRGTRRARGRGDTAPTGTWRTSTGREGAGPGAHYRGRVDSAGGTGRRRQDEVYRAGVYGRRPRVPTA